MQDLQGKVAFVAGGSSGIGLGISRALLDAGMKVVVGYRTEPSLDETLRELSDAGDRLHVLKVDVTDRPGMERAAAETIDVFGKVHVLVNNAGVGVGMTIADTTYDDWDWVIGVNLTGVFNGIHAFLPLIKSHDEGGHVVSTASTLALFVDRLQGGLNGAYSAAKAAVINLTEALRTELRGTGIGASVYVPGLVNTNFADSARSRPEHLAHTGAVQTVERRAELADINAAGMDPMEAGRLVLRGIRNDDLYILSHPEFAQGMQDRHAAMMASIPSDLVVPQARIDTEDVHLRNPMYLDVVEQRGRLAGVEGSGA